MGALHPFKSVFVVPCFGQKINRAFKEHLNVMQLYRVKDASFDFLFF